MNDAPKESILHVLLDAWDRHNTVMVNLLRAIPDGGLEARALLDFAHPVHLIQFLIFHEGYQHGQIKLALKAAGVPLTDADAGPLTWGVWRAR